METLLPSAAESAGYRPVSLRRLRQAALPARSLLLGAWLLSLLAAIVLGLGAVIWQWSGIGMHFGGVSFYVSVYPPLTLCLLWCLLFGLSWGAIPAYTATFCLSLYAGLPPGWAALFALSNPLGLAVFTIAYRALPVPLNLRTADSLFFFALMAFFSSVFSASGAFIWIYTNRIGSSDAFGVWQGWWLGNFLQLLLICGPLLYLLAPALTGWRDRKLFALPQQRHTSLRWILPAAGMVVSGVYLYIALSFWLSRNAVRASQELGTLAGWQHAVELIAASSSAVYMVVAIMFLAMGFLGYRFVRSWTRQLQQAVTAAEEANRAKSGFLARMSHEIRTPMNAITGLTGLALQQTLAPRERDYLQKIRAAADSLLVIINDILDFSRAEIGTLTLEQRPFQLEALLLAQADQLRPQLDAKQLQLLVHIAPEVPLTLQGDTVRLGQVLLNLLSNAVKFTEAGEIRLAVACLQRDAARVTLQFSVSDSGIGIDAANLGRLFQPFAQADESITRRYGGTGLGLAICRQLVAAMGGDIQADSQPGQGSCFHFQLSLPYTPASELPPLTTPLSVLLIERHDSSRQHSQRLLQQLGASVSSTSGIGAARAMLQDGSPPPQLIIADLPEQGDCREHLALLQSLAGERCPVLLLEPAYSTPLDVECQPVRMLARPLLPGALRAALLAPQPLPTAPQLATPAIDIRLQGSRILLAEDNPINQQIAYELLQAAGAQVSCAENGLQAVDMALHDLFDAILMDIHMPQLDGLAAARRIREHGLRLPIIAVTAHAFDAAREEALAAGMDDHLAKPFTPEQLYQAVARHLDHDSPAATIAGIVPQPAAGLSETQHLSLLYKFRKYHAGDAATLRQALREQRIADIQRIAHNLKSVAHYINAPQLQQLALALDDSAKDGTIAAEQVNALATELDTIQQALAQQLPAQD
ncbi:response regulator [Vogesella sp. GCM10023246]|uniref:histidine kinase n=1 Tax=Vogesella oryzagri TaxID=3160864 RepID=A0ABV1M1T1_9NEIS